MLGISTFVGVCSARDAPGLLLHAVGLLHAAAVLLLASGLLHAAAVLLLAAVLLHAAAGLLLAAADARLCLHVTREW